MLTRRHSPSLPLKHLFLSLNHSCTSFSCIFNSTALSKCHGISKQMPVILCSPLAPPSLHSKAKSCLCSQLPPPSEAFAFRNTSHSFSQAKEGGLTGHLKCCYFWLRKVAPLPSLSPSIYQGEVTNFLPRMKKSSRNGAS